MGAGPSVLADIREMPAEGYDMDAFADVAGEFFSEDLFEKNKNQYGLITSRRCINLQLGHAYHLDKQAGMALGDFLDRGDSLADLLVGGFAITHLRQHGYVAAAGGLELLEPLEGDWSMVNTPDMSSLTPLHYAAAKGHTEVALALVAKEATTEACDDRKWVPLHWAAYRGHVDTVRALVADAGSGVDARSKEQMTPLLYGAVTNNIPMVEALLDLGANIDLSNNDRETALFIAVSNKMWDLASVLVERGADVTLGKENGVTPLHWAVRHAHFPLASKLLTQGADVQDRIEERYSMLQVLPKDASTLRKLLVERKADLNALLLDGFNPLHYAVIHCGNDDRSVEIATVLITKLCSRGWDTNARSQRLQWTPLHFAVEKDIIGMPMVKELIALGADPNAKTLDGSCPLLRACFKENMELIAYLLDTNVTPVVQDGRGYTPLHWACAHNSLEMAELLLKPQYRAKAMVDMFNDKGYPPHMLIDIDHGGDEGRALWALLLDHGASPDLFLQLHKSVSSATIASVNKEDGHVAYTAKEKAAKKEEEFDRKEAHMLAVAHGRIDDDLTEL